MRYIIAILLLTGCVSQRKVQTYLDKHPDFTSKDCADRYPVVADTFVNVYYDTINNDIYKYDTTTNTKVVEKVKIVNRVVNKVVTKTITKENTARLEYVRKQKLQDSIKSEIDLRYYQQKLKECQSICDTKDGTIRAYKAKIRMMWIWLVLLLLWSFRRLILALVK